MTSARFAVGIFAIVTALALAFSSCGSDDSGDDDSGSSDGSSSGTPTSLSSAFGTSCAIAGCHGEDGTGGNGYDLQAYASSNSASAYLSIVRNGKGTMTAISSASYSNTDAANDHAYLKAQ